MLIKVLYAITTNMNKYLSIFQTFSPMLERLSDVERNGGEDFKKFRFTGMSKVKKPIG